MQPDDVATVEQIMRLEGRVVELEHRFRHWHVAHENGSDACWACGFDLRDPIHRRVETSQGKESA